jgi:hypothetical protein
MQNPNYVFQFHNPNSAESTASFFLRIAVNANAKNIEEKILHTVASQEKSKTPHKSTVRSASV